MNPRLTQLVLAFGAVYLIWGSTYLAIRIVVASLPPILSAGVRFTTAGLVMLAYAFWRGARLPAAPRDWLTLVLTGTLLLVGGNGLVNWAERWVPSNQAALIVSTSALWLAWMGTFGAAGEKLGRITLCGLLLGFAGVALLVGTGLSEAVAPWHAYVALLLAALLWSFGSIYSRRRPVSAGTWMSVALQMFIAGQILCLIALPLGEYGRWQWHPRGLAALGYLIVFGSCIAYGAYFWLVHEVKPAQLGTYAYVNPAIAVVLGWALLDEHLGVPQLLGSGVILAGVVIVTLAQRRGAVSR